MMTPIAPPTITSIGSRLSALIRPPTRRLSTVSPTVRSMPSEDGRSSMTVHTDKGSVSQIGPIPRCSAAGQSLIEFALVVPVLLLIVLAVLDFGRVVVDYNALTGAARQAGVYADQQNLG